MASRLLDYDGTFFLGMDSSLDPNQVRLGGYWQGINTVNVGGMISCRPGYKCIVQLPAGKLQGATIFRPRLGLEQMLVAIDGAIYVAEFPFKTHSTGRVPNQIPIHEGPLSSDSVSKLALFIAHVCLLNWSSAGTENSKN